MNLVAEGVGHVGNKLRAETDAKLAERDARLDRLEEEIADVGRIAWLRRHKVHELVIAMEQGGADEEERIKREWAWDHDMTVCEVDELLREFMQ